MIDFKSFPISFLDEKKTMKKQKKNAGGRCTYVYRDKKILISIFTDANNILYYENN